MASYNYSNTAEDKAKVPLLSTYLCKVCKRYKSNSLFANKELAKYKNDILMRKTFNGVSAKLTCRECKGEGRQELECEGPCGQTKGIDCFSKAQRSSGGSRWCKECILWKDAQEPGAPEADGLAPGSKAPVEEADTDDVSDDGTEGISYSLGGTSIAGKSSTAQDHSYKPPHVREEMSAKTSGPGSSTGSQSVGGSSHLPPHLHTKENIAMTSVPGSSTRSQSSASNPYGSTQGEEIASQSGMSVVKKNVYNSRVQRTTGRGNWAKPAGGPRVPIKKVVTAPDDEDTPTRTCRQGYDPESEDEM